MSAIKEKFRINGEWVTGEKLEFKSTSIEPTITYELNDGSRLRVRTLVTSVIRLDKYNQIGEPIYFVMSQTLCDSIVPEQFKESNLIQNELSN